VFNAWMFRVLEFLLLAQIRLKSLKVWVLKSRPKLILFHLNIFDANFGPDCSQPHCHNIMPKIVMMLLVVYCPTPVLTNPGLLDTLTLYSVCLPHHR